MNDEWLELSYGSFGAVEEAFHALLEESLAPRGPDVLYDLVAGVGLVPGATAVDVGCGEGRHTGRLAERFGLAVIGVDPVPSQLELAHAANPSCRFELGRAEELPLTDETVDLVWCRDVLVHVVDLDRAYAEFRRVLRPGGTALVYQMFSTPRLEPREASRFLPTMGIVPGSAESARTEAAIERAGLILDELVVLGSEWGEHAEEAEGKPGKRLLWAARLLRDPERYVARFGRAHYDVMLGDCLWHVYAMIGKLERRAYVLRCPAYS